MVEIINLSVNYKSTNHQVIKNLSFKVSAGEVIAILGPSGCGKTTLLNAISGLLSSKTAEVEGEIIFPKKLPNPVIRTVFQEPRLLPWRTVLGNVGYGLETKEAGKDKNKVQNKCQRILRAVDLEAFSGHYPSQLSVGMKQRVNFARALVCDPDILVLDEPFSALDGKTKEMIQEEFLRVIRKGKITTIIVTHNVDEALALADRIIRLEGSPCFVKETVEKKDYKEKFGNSFQMANHEA